MNNHQLKTEVLRRVDSGESLDSLAKDIAVFFRSWAPPEKFMYNKLQSWNHHPSVVKQALDEIHVPTEWIRNIADATRWPSTTP
jgi:hypothetical protein